MLKLKPNNVGFIPIFEGDYSRSSIIITPDTAKERCKQGIVKYIGSAVKDIKIGDYCVFSAYDGSLVRFANELTLIMPEDAIDCSIRMDYDIIIDNIPYPYYELMEKIASQFYESPPLVAKERHQRK